MRCWVWVAVAFLGPFCADGFQAAPKAATTAKPTALKREVPIAKRAASAPHEHAPGSSRARCTTTSSALFLSVPSADAVTTGPDEAMTAMTYTIEALEETHLGFASQVMQDPVFWSSAIMLSIIFLLFSWEKSIDAARSTLPETLQPVVDTMLVEMAGVGFVGLILNAFVVKGPLLPILQQLSEAFLGDSELLWTSYQFLDMAFFEVAITFFIIAAATVAATARHVESFEYVSKTVFDLNNDGCVDLGEIAEVLDVPQLVVDLDGDGVLSQYEIQFALEKIPRRTIWQELMRSKREVQGETLMVQQQLCNLYGIPEENPSELENFFCSIFARNLKEIIELSSLTWLTLIPVIAQGRSIDLSNDVVSTASSNSFTSCGEFISSPGYLIASSFICITACIWAVWNFWKMSSVKNMLVPTLVRDSAAKGSAVLLPPRYNDASQMAKFSSSPFPFGLVERIWGKPPRSKEEELFGAAGRKGPSFYRNSIKHATWIGAVQLVFFSSQIVLRDVAALLAGVPESVGRPDMLLPELALYSFFCLLIVGELWLVPNTFLDYSIIVSQIPTLHEVDKEATLMDFVDTKNERNNQQAEKLRSEMLNSTI